jgi:deoxycytidine triphosphate deaminase
MSLLSDQALLTFLDEGMLFKPGSWSRKSVRAAKYDLRLSGDLLIRPDNVFVSTQHPGDGKPFVLEPGQTALISTMERLVVPPELAGIIGPRLATSDTGLYIFGGMLIDPGFGYVWNDAKDEWSAEGRPLVFHAANLGQKPVPMIPGIQRIASLSFITVDSPYDRKNFPQDLQTTSADELILEVRKEQDTRPYALGFLAELEKLNTKVDKIDVGARQLNLFGTIVVLAALFGAIVSVLFGLTKDGGSQVDLTWGSVAVVCGIVLGGILALSVSSHFAAKAFVTLRLQRRRSGKTVL